MVGIKVNPRLRFKRQSEYCFQECLDDFLLFQYLHGWSRYNEAVKYALTMPKYRNKAMQRAREEGLLNNLKKGKKSKVRLFLSIIWL